MTVNIRQITAATAIDLCHYLNISKHAAQNSDSLFMDKKFSTRIDNYFTPRSLHRVNSNPEQLTSYNSAVGINNVDKLQIRNDNIHKINLCSVI